MFFNVLIDAFDFTGGKFKIVGLFRLIIAIRFCVLREAVKRGGGDVDFANAQRNTLPEHFGGDARSPVQHERHADRFVNFFEHVKPK